MSNFFDEDAPTKKPNFFDEEKAPPPDDSYSGRFWRIWQNTKDEARVAGNTFGAYDRIAAYLGNNDAAALAAERAKTEAASQRLGPIDSTIASIGGYLPLAAATGGAGLGPIATSAIGGALAGAGHSTATDLTGTAQDAVIGAGINAATGGIIAKGGPYVPALARNAATHFAPRVAGGFLGAHFGPTGMWLGSDIAGRIANKIAGPSRALTPTAPTSWFWPGANTAAQGYLSGQGQ